MEARRKQSSEMSKMEISSRKQNDAYIIKIKGTIDNESITKLGETAEKIKQANPQSICVNLVDVDLCRRGRCFRFTNQLDWMKKHEGHICVVNPSLQVEKVFKLSQLREVFENVVPVKLRKKN